MRIAFLGSTRLGYATLEGLIASDHTVALVITHPKGVAPNIYDRLWEAPVAVLATDNGVACREQSSANDDNTLNLLREAAPDIIVSADWRSWLNSAITTLPPQGGINIHEALLPRYAGCAPLNWAIAAGETAVGVTTHFMVDELDMGDIILQERIPVAEDETTTEVFHRVCPLFPKLALRTLALIEEDAVIPQPQDRSIATYYHKREQCDGLIDWHRRNKEIYNLIRAQSDPYPTAYTFLGEQQIGLTRARLGGAKYRGTPGRICARGPEGVIVICGASDTGDGQALELIEVELSDGVRVPANSILRVGDQLADGFAGGRWPEAVWNLDDDLSQRVGGEPVSQ